jgi:uncharacterized protein with GYD domain
MPTYVLMTKLSWSSLGERRSSGREWLKKVEDLCPGLKWVAHYALLGPYDFMDVYEAPSDEAAFRVSLLSRELGAVKAESWPALPYEDFLEIAERVEGVLEGDERSPKKKKKKK